MSFVSRLFSSQRLKNELTAVQGKSPEVCPSLESCPFLEGSFIRGSTILVFVDSIMHHANIVVMCNHFIIIQCNRTESLNALHSLIFREPKKLAVIGSGCSVATEPTAEVSHYYNVTQVIDTLFFLPMVMENGERME